MNGLALLLGMVVAVAAITLGVATQRRRSDELPGVEPLAPTGVASSLPAPPPRPGTEGTGSVVVDVTPGPKDHRAFATELRRGLRGDHLTARLVAAIAVMSIALLVAFSVHSGAAALTTLAICIGQVLLFGANLRLRAIALGQLAGRVTLEGRGCRFARPGSERTWAWSSLTRAADRTDAIVLVFDQLAGVVLPKSAFTDPADAARVMALVRSNRPDLVR